MLAIHVNWTAPSISRRQPGDAIVDPLEILTSITTALFWKRSGGTIELYTDAAGQRFYEEAGLADAYDRIDTRTLDSFTRRSDINPAQTPCVGRMQVLASLSRPFVAMDLDLAFFGAGDFPYTASDLCCLHWELPMPPSYPTPDAQFMPEGFALPSGLDFLSLVPNIAFLYVGRPDFFRPYADLASDYVRRASEQNGSLPTPSRAAAAPEAGLPTNVPTIFADQRLLGMLAAQQGLRVETLWNEIFTCAPFGDRWEVLARNAAADASAHGLVSPYWVLDPRRFDGRKQTVDCVHLWFEKSLYPVPGRHYRRRQAVIERIAQRLASAFPDNPIAARVLARLPRPHQDTSFA
ncbi:MAG: hypothetical protein JOZ42_01240 [Acetobacteraceae bacterium]|nr:hypothetical protein [Acetobacteraceae bacterium]